MEGSSSERQMLSAALDKLPPRTREIFKLHRFEGMSPADIALDLGIARQTVAAHIARALTQCCRPMRRLFDAGVEESAAEWFARMRDQAAPPPERAHFSAWLTSDPRHREVWDVLNRIWVSLEALDPMPREGLPPAMEVGPEGVGSNSRPLRAVARSLVRQSKRAERSSP